METNSQLIKKIKEGGYNNVYPIAYIDGIIDKESNEKLSDILIRYNNIMVPWQGDIASTRNRVPCLMRRQGIVITYITNLSEIVTEVYKGTVEDIKNNWADNINWELVPDLKFVQDNASKLPDGTITPEKLSPALQELISQSGSVVNMPDDEDLEQEDMVLKFKDRPYNSELASGKGYKILRKNWTKVGTKTINLLTQDMINEPNTIYEIRYDFDLDNKDVSIPENSFIKFNGGSINVNTGNLKINDYFITRVSDISPYNTVNRILNEYVTPQMFGAKADNNTNDIKPLQCAINTSLPVHLGAHIYYIEGQIIPSSGICILKGSSTSETIIRTNYEGYFLECPYYTQHNRTSNLLITNITFINKSFPATSLNLNTNEKKYNYYKNKHCIHSRIITRIENVKFLYYDITFDQSSFDGDNYTYVDGMTFKNVISTTCQEFNPDFDRFSDCDFIFTNISDYCQFKQIAGLHIKFGGRAHPQINGCIAVSIIIDSSDTTVDCYNWHLEFDDNDIKHGIKVGIYSKLNMINGFVLLRSTKAYPIFKLQAAILELKDFSCSNARKYNNVGKSCIIESKSSVIKFNSSYGGDKLNTLGYGPGAKGNISILDTSNNTIRTLCSNSIYKDNHIENLEIEKSIYSDWFYENSSVILNLENTNENSIENNKNITYKIHLLFDYERLFISEFSKEQSIITSNNNPINIKFNGVSYIKGLYIERIIEDKTKHLIIETGPISSDSVKMIDYGEYVNNKIQWKDGVLECNKIDYGLSESAVFTLKNGIINITNLNSKPSVNIGKWQDGDTLIIKGEVYIYNRNNLYNINKYKNGTFIQKPSDISIGSAYFCTDKKSPESSEPGLMIYHKGDNTWVDSLSRIVDDNYPILTKGTTSQRPTLTSTDGGFEYYDSTLKKKILWNGTAWVNLDGTTLE